MNDAAAYLTPDLPPDDLGVFLEEAEEQLRLLEEEVATFEVGATPERLAAAFRAAHTLKGSSSAAGFYLIARAAHRFESLLEQLRDTAVGSSMHPLKSLLEAVDELRGMVTQLAATIAGTPPGLGHGFTGLLPLSFAFTGFQQMVRDLCRSTGKQVELRIKSGGIECEARAVQSVRNATLHMLRNAIVHGIESPLEREDAGKPISGLVAIEARRRSGELVITVRDDGRGVDLQGIRRSFAQNGANSPVDIDTLPDAEVAGMVFYAGVSTQKQVTMLSGRGVGLDVARKSVKAVDGVVDVKTKQGAGTLFRIRIPVPGVVGAMRPGRGGDASLRMDGAG